MGVERNSIEKVRDLASDPKVLERLVEDEEAFLGVLREAMG